jgi:large subunit ribosomal protein L25
MAKTIELKAEARSGSGKGAARAARRAGRVPAVIYGDKQGPEAITLTYKDLIAPVNTGRFTATLVDLHVGGKTVRAIPRDVQFDPVRDFIIHVDFLRLGKDSSIRVAVPVHFRNHEASPGLKQGGVLNIVRHELDLFVRADNLPDEILIDLTGLPLGASVHVHDIKLPEGAKPATSEKDATIATIATPAGLTAEEEAAAAPAAGEVPAANQKAPDPKAAAAAAPAPAKKK